jgi:hypothetical protein
VDIEQVRKLLEGRSTRQSRWEFVNFVLEPYGDYQGRAAQAVLARRRDIADQLASLPSDSGLALTQRTELAAEAEHLDRWLDQHSPEELAQMLSTLEEQEESYWPEHLGRRAAVDLLSRGKVSREVMSLAVLLSEEGYRKFTEVCGNITYVINTITREVEAQQGYASLPEGQPR